MTIDSIPEQLLPLLKTHLGSSVQLKTVKVGNQRRDYLVLLIELSVPNITVVVKLAGPDTPYAHLFAQTAVIQSYVSSQTHIPMPQTIAADDSYTEWPWRYLIKTYLPGEEWAAVQSRLNEKELASAYAQMGEAIAQLHNITFPAFGEFDGNGEVRVVPTYAEALQQHARRQIQTPRLQTIFLDALAQHQSWFEDVCVASLCHEDLHKHNILFDYRAGKWQLATILDFDKAWAGHCESDMGRLDIWTGMTNAHFWQSYQSVRSIDPNYAQRRPIYQLLWCLEYAQPTEKHLADTQAVCQALNIPLITSFD